MQTFVIKDPAGMAWGIKAERNRKGTSFDQGATQSSKKLSAGGELLVSKYHSVRRETKVSSLTVDCGLGSRQVAGISTCLNPTLGLRLDSPLWLLPDNQWHLGIIEGLWTWSVYEKEVETVKSDIFIKVFPHYRTQNWKIQKSGKRYKCYHLVTTTVSVLMGFIHLIQILLKASYSYFPQCFLFGNSVFT